MCSGARSMSSLRVRTVASPTSQWNIFPFLTIPFSSTTIRRRLLVPSFDCYRRALRRDVRCLDCRHGRYRNPADSLIWIQQLRQMHTYLRLRIYNFTSVADKRLRHFDRLFSLNVEFAQYFRMCWSFMAPRLWAGLVGRVCQGFCSFTECLFAIAFTCVTASGPTFWCALESERCGPCTLLSAGCFVCAKHGWDESLEWPRSLVT